MIKKFKSKIMILINALIILFLVGCSGGSYKSTNSIENNTKNSMEMSYSSFDGHKFNSIKLKEGDELNLNIEIVTKEGTLKITLVDKNDNELFKIENPNELISKKIKIEKDSTYKLKVEGKHKGSYKITWNVKHS
ncbi:major membrane immunogen (membrane-anchored lipoprotein) [Clostridium pascui]|uniref:hypothetical protein n=1 Tax=Clostridium pascui TaxID=46609 RepID=UPI00195A3FF0|nr:hypothetical protein [Clostridium pascui]MBM7872156.1 major membrane immunogen (membrane-anchored lipoprotein) [Clostridium pascui]